MKTFLLTVVKVVAIGTLLLTLGVTTALAATTTMMPNRDAVSGTSLVIWGNTTEALGASYSFAFGDGSPNATGTVGQRSYITTNHTYTTALPTQTFTATLTVGASSASVQIKVFNTTFLNATQLADENVNLAIEDGLRYMYYSQDNRETNYNNIVGGTASLNKTSWDNYHAWTSMVILAFENHGHTPVSGSIYSPIVQAGLNYLFSVLGNSDGGSAAMTPHGVTNIVNPCQGSISSPCHGLAPTYDGEWGYTVPILTLAITGSGTPNRTVDPSIGIATYVAGQTYQSIVQRLANVIMWNQADSNSSLRGGWFYNGFYSNYSDGSQIGWNVLALTDAELFGAVTDPNVKVNLAYVLAATTDADGSMGYTGPSNNYNNVAKTAVRLEALAYMGVGLSQNPPVGGPTPQKSVDWINDEWQGYSGLHTNHYTCGTDNKGYMYSMFNVFKGFRTIAPSMTTLPNVPRTDKNWYLDYRDFLVTTQTSPATDTGGSWAGGFQFSCWGYSLNGVTALAEVILSPTALILPTSLTLSPPSATNAVGTSHTVTATATSAGGQPIAGVTVNFSITSGPNSAQTGSGLTNAQGMVTFTYTSTLSGTDTIVAKIGTSLTSNSVTKTWTSGDTTAPACVLTNILAGPPKQLIVTVQDPGSGLSRIVVVKSVNTSTALPVFSVGSTGSFVVTGTKINQAASSSLALDVFDVAGNKTSCDPIDLTLTETTTLTDISQAESKIDIRNGGVMPGNLQRQSDQQQRGLRRITITVNDKKFDVTGLSDNESRSIDVSSAMKPGDKNVIKLEPKGPRGGSADILIHD